MMSPEADKEIYDEYTRLCERLEWLDEQGADLAKAETEAYKEMYDKYMEEEQRECI